MSNDSGSRLRGAFESLSLGARPREDCPAPEALWAALHDESSLEERRSIVTHMSDCFSCAEDWRLAKAAREAWAEGSAAPATDLPPRNTIKFPAPRASPRRRQLFALAAVFALAVVGLGLLRLVGPDTSGSHTAEYRQAMEGVVESLVEQGAELPRDRCLLRWSEAESDVLYDVLVTDEQLREVFSSEALEATELLIPAGALEEVAEGDKLLWRVGLTATDGGRRESETFEFVLAGPVGEEVSLPAEGKNES